MAQVNSRIDTLRKKTRLIEPGLVGFYDIQWGNGAGRFFQPRSPHGVQKLSISVNVALMQPSFVISAVSVTVVLWSLHCINLYRVFFKFILLKSAATLFFNICHYFFVNRLSKDHTRLYHVPEGFSNKNLSEWDQTQTETKPNVLFRSVSTV